MFRIPIRIGKNNEIEEMSEISGLTDRGGAFSGRSINELKEAKIFEEEIEGNDFNIFSRKDDIIDLQNHDIPIDLMGDT